MSQLFDSPGAAYRTPINHAKWVTAAFILYACADLYALYFFTSELDFVRALTGAGDGFDYDAALEGAERFQSKAETMAAALLGFKVLVIIAWCLWTHRVASNVRAFDRPMMTSPGWAVGWYFIPILNIWKPYSAIKEIWRGSDPADRGNTEPDDYWASEGKAVPFFFIAWWLTYLGAGVIDRIAAFWLEDPTGAGWVSGMHYAIVAIAIDLVAVSLALVVCHRLTRRQEARAHANVPQARAI